MDRSDTDFYIVVDDEISDLPAVTIQAYQAIRNSKKHPVDIIVGRESRFEKRKRIPSVENEVFEKGVLLYESGNRTVACIGKNGFWSGPKCIFGV